MRDLGGVQNRDPRRAVSAQPETFDAPETQGERMKSTKRRGDEFYTTIKVILSVLI
jgi:hypothetical protein